MDKISEQLFTIIQSSDKDDIIAVDIWFYDTINDEIEKSVKADIGINKETIANTYTRVNYAADTIDTYIEAKRSRYSSVQTEKHNDFIEKHDLTKVSASKATKNSPKVGVIFVSKYAPLIKANLTVKEIYKLTNDSSVQIIDYSPEMESAPYEEVVLTTQDSGESNLTRESNTSASAIRADYLRDYMGYTGSGIKIGMIEGGVPDLSYGFFNNNIEVDNRPNINKTGHATLVAAIMVGKTITYDGVIYKGIVPDAMLYATNQLSMGDDKSHFYENVEWLLDKGVNIINMSDGYFVEPPNYGNIDRWIDHLAINHSVHFVVAVGNNGEYSGYVESPALAYNVIAVGNLDHKNTVNTDDDIISSSSSYLEGGGTNRPDLVAPGENIEYVYMSNSGTSFAAPHVTGVVAQLCQAKPALKILQDAMKAILTASIYNLDLAFTSFHAVYDEYGAGPIDAWSSYDTAINSRYITASFAANTAAGTTRTYTFNTTSLSKRNRVSLTWLKHSTVSGNHSSATPADTQIADLDLEVYDPNGNLVASSTTATNNTEIVEFTPITGTYQIKVKLYQTPSKTVYYGLAWY